MTEPIDDGLEHPEITSYVEAADRLTGATFTKWVKAQQAQREARSEALRQQAESSRLSKREADRVHGALWHGPDTSGIDFTRDKDESGSDKITVKAGEAEIGSAKFFADALASNKKQNIKDKFGVEAKGDIYRFQSIDVDPLYQGHGVGKELYLRAMNAHPENWFYNGQASALAHESLYKMQQEGLIELHKWQETARGQDIGAHIKKITPRGRQYLETIDVQRRAKREIGKAISGKGASTAMSPEESLVHLASMRGLITSPFSKIGQGIAKGAGIADPVAKTVPSVASLTRPLSEISPQAQSQGTDAGDIPLGAAPPPLPGAAPASQNQPMARTTPSTALLKWINAVGRTIRSGSGKFDEPKASLSDVQIQEAINRPALPMPKLTGSAKKEHIQKAWDTVSRLWPEMAAKIETIHGYSRKEMKARETPSAAFGRTASGAYGLNIRPRQLRPDVLWHELVHAEQAADDRVEFKGTGQTGSEEYLRDPIEQEAHQRQLRAIGLIDRFEQMQAGEEAETIRAKSANLAALLGGLLRAREDSPTGQQAMEPGALAEQIQGKQQIARTAARTTDIAGIGSGEVSETLEGQQETPGTSATASGQQPTGQLSQPQAGQIPQADPAQQKRTKIARPPRMPSLKEVFGAALQKAKSIGAKAIFGLSGNAAIEAGEQHGAGTDEESERGESPQKQQGGKTTRKHGIVETALGSASEMMGGLFDDPQGKGRDDTQAALLEAIMKLTEAVEDLAELMKKHQAPAGVDPKDGSFKPGLSQENGSPGKGPPPIPGAERNNSSHEMMMGMLTAIMRIAR